MPLAAALWVQRAALRNKCVHRSREALIFLVGRHFLARCCDLPCHRTSLPPGPRARARSRVQSRAMVFYFTSSTGHVIYMGKDKFENEDLIKYAWAEDHWFHVDDLSSAHVYLRYPAPGTKHKPVPVSEIPPELVAECSQLVKANSIEGCKKASVRVIYTPASNLKKTSAMATGQVSYHDTKVVKRTTIEKEKAIVNALEKTREEL